MKRGDEIARNVPAHATSQRSVRRSTAGALTLALFLAGCSGLPATQPGSSAPAPDASISATPIVPRPVRVSGSVTTRWVSTYGTGDFETGDGDRCRSAQVKAGDSIRLATTVDTEATLGRGRVRDERCSFPFSAKVPLADTLKIYVSGHGSTSFDDRLDPGGSRSALTGLQIALPSEFRKAERRYLKAKGVDLGSKRADRVVSDAQESCNDVKGTREERLTIIVDRLSVYRKPIRFLCPRFKRDLAGAEHAFKDGNFAVPKDVKPGTYRTYGPASACYWERSTRGGHVIDSRFVSDAPNGTQVTIKGSDGGFKSEGCDLWMKVR